MKKRIIIQSVLLLAVLITAGFGCKGLSQAEQDAIRPVTLTYWTVHNNTAALREFANQYQQIRPYVTVNIRTKRAEDFDQDLIEALADDAGPDIVSIDVTNIAEHRHRLQKMPSSVQVASITTQGTISKETVVNVFSNSMPSKRSIESDYIKAISEDAIFGGSVYGLPLAVDTLALYYNRDLLDRAGIAEAPETWEEFLDAVRKTTTYNVNSQILQSGVAAGTVNNIPNAFDLISLLMLQNGVTMGQGSTVTFARGLGENIRNHPTIQALQFYVDFANPTKDIYTWDTNMEDAFDAFVRGKSAFYFGFASERSRILGRAPQMDLEIIEVPQLQPENPVNVARYSIESVVKKSKNKDEAWDFIRFITRAEKVLEYSEQAGQPSPWRIHVEQQKNSPILGPFASQALRMTNWYHGKDKAAAIRAFETLVEGFKLPVSSQEDITRDERDVNLVNRAAQVIQQTY